MNAIALRHYNVTVAYRTSMFNSARRELAHRIRRFLNLRRFRKTVRTMIRARLAA